MISKAHRFLSFSSNKSGGEKKGLHFFFPFGSTLFLYFLDSENVSKLIQRKGIIVMVSAETESHYMLEKEIHHDQERNNTIRHRRYNITH